jgi:ribosomal protein L7/L12
MLPKKQMTPDMNALHDLTEGDADEVARNVSRIMKVADDMAQDGNARAFELYKLARDTLEILAFDRISRDTLAKISSGDERFQGWTVSNIVKGHMQANQKINAIKEFRSESGLGLKEAKDWVEAYMSEHGMSTF